MFKILTKYNIVAILPIENSFYYTFKTPKKVSLSHKLVALNYSRYSPFNNPQIIYYNDDNLIHLWFYENKIDAPIIIPESYILSNIYKKRNKNSIIIIEDLLYKILIISEGNLVSSVTSKTFDNQFLQMSKDQYNVNSHIIIKTSEYKTELTKAINSLPLKELIRWKSHTITARSVLYSTLNLLAYPLAALLAFVMLIHYTYGQSQIRTLSQLEETYKEIKLKNDPIREAIQSKQALHRKWSSFIDKELIYPDIMISIQSITAAVSSQHATVKNLVIADGSLTLTIETRKNPITILNALINIPYFKNITIKRSFKQKNGTKQVTFDLTLIKLEMNL
ncbi:MAG: hypothetical protein U9R50_01425 [Campylobacterota bacterium]|nr:hypothetical protein [Campylobacterota bacterium]